MKIDQEITFNHSFILLKILFHQYSMNRVWTLAEFVVQFGFMLNWLRHERISIRSPLKFIPFSVKVSFIALCSGNSDTINKTPEPDKAQRPMHV